MTFDSRSRMGLQPSHQANWYTKSGVRKKRKLIEQNGLPDFRYCKFVTLTVDPAIGTPKEAYEMGMERMKTFFAQSRAIMGPYEWGRRLEFQENEYPHWHLIITYPKKIPKECLKLFTEWWNLGRVNVKGITAKDFNYLFKYASKSSENGFDEQTGLPYPSWVLDYQTITKDGRVSTGMRFWQTSKGFYTKNRQQTQQSKEKRFSLLPLTMRQKYLQQLRKARLILRNEEGTVLNSVNVVLKHSYGKLIHTISLLAAQAKATSVPGELRIKCSLNQILKEILICQKTKLTQLQFQCLDPRTVYVSMDWW